MDDILQSEFFGDYVIEFVFDAGEDILENK